MLFRQPFKIEQGIDILHGLHTSFNGFKEDERLFVYRMYKILRQDHYKWLAHVSRIGYCNSSLINCNI